MPRGPAHREAHVPHEHGEGVVHRAVKRWEKNDGAGYVTVKFDHVSRPHGGSAVATKKYIDSVPFAIKTKTEHLPATVLPTPRSNTASCSDSAATHSKPCFEPSSPTPASRGPRRSPPGAKRERDHRRAQHAGHRSLVRVANDDLELQEARRGQRWPWRGSAWCAWSGRRRKSWARGVHTLSSEKNIFYQNFKNPTLRCPQSPKYQGKG